MLQDLSPKIESDLITRLALQDSQIRDTQDEETRTNIHLRRSMVTLVNGIDELLNQAAEQLAATESDNRQVDAFDIDNARDVIVWQLAEFLCLSQLPRDPYEPPIAAGHQVTKRHARAWFNLSPADDGDLPSVENKQVVQS